MSDEKGTNYDPKEGCSEWFDLEAECSDASLDGDLEKLFEENTDTDISDLIDNEDTIQGNSRELLCQQESEESEQQIHWLKRKYISSQEVLQLSPRLQSISISPQHKSKRRLFEQDSGLELSFNEAQDFTQQTVEVPATDSVPPEQGAKGLGIVKDLLKCSNVKAMLLAKFKEAFGVGFMELTRQYRSSKTCCRDWVLTVYAVQDELLESSKQLLIQHCAYIWLHQIPPMCLYLLCFNVGKSRETVLRLLTNLLQVSEVQIIAEPPKLRSTLSALFWYKGSMNPNVYAHGEYPEWIMTQTMISHHTAEATQFDLSTMVQYAYDNELTDEAEIAYHYAKLADTDANARAFLQHNSQARLVKDCAIMVRHYRRGEMKEMSMSAWIHKKLAVVEGEGHWSDIVKFIRYQEINFIQFLNAFKLFLHNTPKKSCLLFYGPPDTGKSMFTMSLIKLLKGKVLSFANYKSTFWLQPVADTKVALIDDVTYVCWDYIEQYLRNALDGNTVCLDMKHRAPCQIRFPPLMLTSNIDIMKEEKYRYLYSRIQAFAFPHKFPFDSDNKPQFKLTDQSWKSFFERLWRQLDLSDHEDEGDDGYSQRTFQCTTRESNGHL
jgi:hypothetical protein